MAALHADDVQIIERLEAELAALPGRIADRMCAEVGPLTWHYARLSTVKARIRDIVEQAAKATAPGGEALLSPMTGKQLAGAFDAMFRPPTESESEPPTAPGGEPAGGPGDGVSTSGRGL